MSDIAMQPHLFTASVPVFIHYLDRIAALVGREDVTDDHLAARLAPDMAPAGVQFAIAVNFSLRSCLKLVGKKVAGMPQQALDKPALLEWIALARARLDMLKPDDFAPAAGLTIQHRAGGAFLSQSGTEYLHLFGMPNFMFHLAMGYANLRAAGLPIGKADFDGLHFYPEGFVL